jgi:hypothetical protein
MLIEKEREEVGRASDGFAAMEKLLVVYTASDVPA